MANALKHREVITLRDMLADDNRFLHGELRRLSGDEIVGANFGLKDVMHKVNQVAPLDSPVLLLGETGVGKDGPFISVNCGAIPDTLIDSELFGHEKGAFERLGGTKTISLDIRIIAATNQNLKERIKTNQFREDLWFRLNVFPITIPPLRRRKSDIPSLLQHFLSLKSKQLKLPAIPSISPDALKTLMDYHWPGNVRELENIVERTLILDRKGPLNFDHLKADQGEGDGHMPGEPHDPFCRRVIDFHDIIEF
jgi:transcriptional regulator with PAS, ATPase and Fis domain